MVLMLLDSCKIWLKFFMDFADGKSKTPFALSNQASKSTCRSEKTDRERCIMMSIVHVFHLGQHESDPSKNFRGGHTSRSGQGYQLGSPVCDLVICSLACRWGLVGIFNDSGLTEKAVSVVSQVSLLQSKYGHFWIHLLPCRRRCQVHLSLHRKHRPHSWPLRRSSRRYLRHHKNVELRNFLVYHPFLTCCNHRAPHPIGQVNIEDVELLPPPICSRQLHQMNDTVIGNTRQLLDVCTSVRAIQDIFCCVFYYPGMPDMSIARQIALATLEVNVGW